MLLTCPIDTFIMVGTSNLNPETRDKTVRYLVAQMDRLLGYRRPKSYKVSTKNCGVYEHQD